MRSVRKVRPPNVDEECGQNRNLIINEGDNIKGLEWGDTHRRRCRSLRARWRPHWEPSLDRPRGEEGPVAQPFVGAYCDHSTKSVFSRPWQNLYVPRAGGRDSAPQRCQTWSRSSSLRPSRRPPCASARSRSRQAEYQPKQHSPHGGVNSEAVSIRSYPASGPPHHRADPRVAAARGVVSSDTLSVSVGHTPARWGDARPPTSLWGPRRNRRLAE
jgi:hypothetical protein